MYEKISYALEKIIVYQMFIVFPVIMHDKLNDVTKTRYLFFTVVAFAGFAVMLVNEAVNMMIYIVKQKQNCIFNTGECRAF